MEMDSASFTVTINRLLKRVGELTKRVGELTCHAHSPDFPRKIKDLRRLAPSGRGVEPHKELSIDSYESNEAQLGTTL